MSNSDDQSTGSGHDGADAAQEEKASAAQSVSGKGELPPVVAWSPLGELLDDGTSENDSELTGNGKSSSKTEPGVDVDSSDGNASEDAASTDLPPPPADSEDPLDYPPPRVDGLAGLPENAPFNPPRVASEDPVGDPSPTLEHDDTDAQEPTASPAVSPIDVPPAELLAAMFDAPSSDEVVAEEVPPPPDDAADHFDGPAPDDVAAGSSETDTDTAPVNEANPDPASTLSIEILPLPPIADPWIRPSDTESDADAHATQWEDETPWGAAPTALEPETKTYSWHVPVRRETEYDGPVYTKTGEIVDAPSTDVEEPASDPPPSSKSKSESKSKPESEPESDEDLSPDEEDRETSADEADTRKQLGGRILLIVAVVAVAAGVVFAVWQALRGQPGAASPDLAAERMIEALENQDALGIYTLWLPSERLTMSGEMVHVLAELDQLEGSDGKFASLITADEGTGLPAGTSLEISDVTYDIESVGETVSYLTTTGGTVRGTIDPEAIPSLVGEPTAEDLGREFDLAADPISVALVREDGAWYFSLYYTAAENIRRAQGLALPSFEKDRSAVGADTAREAVEELTYSLARLDFTGVVDRLDPVEFRSLHDYREFLDPSLDETADEIARSAERAEISWELTKVVTSTNDIRGWSTVGVERIEVTATTAEDGVIDVVMTDGCWAGTGADGVVVFDSCELSPEMADVFGLEAFNVPDWLAEDREQLNIRVVERNGRWYVAGLPTVLGNIADQLAAMAPSEWEDRKRSVTNLAESVAVESVEFLELSDR